MISRWYIHYINPYSCPGVVVLFCFLFVLLFLGLAPRVFHLFEFTNASNWYTYILCSWECIQL